MPAHYGHDYVPVEIYPKCYAQMPGLSEKQVIGLDHAIRDCVVTEEERRDLTETLRIAATRLNEVIGTDGRRPLQEILAGNIRPWNDKDCGVLEFDFSCIERWDHQNSQLEGALLLASPAEIRPHLPKLIQYIQNDGYFEIQDAAAVAMARTGEDGVPALLTILRQTDDSFASHSIISAFGKVGPVTPDVVPALIATLMAGCPAIPLSPNGETWLRYCSYDAWYALRDIGAAAIPDLTAALKTELTAKRSDVVLPKDFYSPWEASTTTYLDMEAKGIRVKMNLLWLLHGMGEAATAAAPVVQEALQDPNSDVRQLASETLARIRPAVKAPG